MEIMAKLKFKSDVFKSFNDSTSYKLFYKFVLWLFFFSAIDLSAKFYQQNKERLQKKYQNLSEEEK